MQPHEFGTNVSFGTIYFALTADRLISSLAGRSAYVDTITFHQSVQLVPRYALHKTILNRYLQLRPERYLEETNHVAEA